MTKKILLTLLIIISLNSYAQTFSTGKQVLSGDLTLDLETDATTTKVTLTGPANAWFAVGFGGLTMSAGADVLRTDGTTVTDARATFRGLPPADASQDWNVSSNTISGNVRTIVASRPNNTGDANDFIFSNSAGSINIIWAFGTSTTYAYHGGNRGATTLGVTLSTRNVTALDFELYPNPTNDIVNIQLPTNVNEANASLYDFSGRLVKTKKVSTSNQLVDLEDLGSGMYILKVQFEDKLGVKRIIKN